MVFWLVASPSLRTRLYGLIKKNKVIYGIIAVFFIWKIFSSFFSSGSVDESLKSSLRDAVYCFILMNISMLLISTERHVIHIFRCLMLATMIVCFFGLLEIVVQHSLFAAFAASQDAAEKISDSYRDDRFRVLSTFPNSLSLASFLCFVFPLLAYSYFHEQKALWKLVSVVVLSTSFIVLYNTYSRAGYGVMFALIGLLSLFHLKKWVGRLKQQWRILYSFVFLVVFVLFAVALFIFAEQLAQGQSAKESGSSEIRALQMEIGFIKMAQHPIIGFGPGNAGDVIGLKTKTVDNYYLTLAMESGVTATVLFLVILLVFVRKSYALGVLKWPGRDLGITLFLMLLGNMVFMIILSLEQVLPLLFIAFSIILFLENQANQWMVTGMRGRSTM